MNHGTHQSQIRLSPRWSLLSYPRTQCPVIPRFAVIMRCQWIAARTRPCVGLTSKSKNIDNKPSREPTFRTTNLATCTKHYAHVTIFLTLAVPSLLVYVLSPSTHPTTAPRQLSRASHTATALDIWTRPRTPSQAGIRVPEPQEKAAEIRAACGAKRRLNNPCPACIYQRSATLAPHYRAVCTLSCTLLDPQTSQARSSDLG